MYYAQAMNKVLADANNPDANLWADQVAQCFERDAQLCNYYNKVMANGKWDGMMTQKHIGYTSWNDDFPADRMPEVKRVSDVQAGGYVFAPSQGYVAMEAEHYFEAKAPAGTQWSIYPDYGRTRSAVALTPYTEPVDGASLTYRFRSEKGTVFDQGTNRKALIPSGVRKRPKVERKSEKGTVAVHIIVKSTLDFLNVGGFEYTVTLDGSEPQTVNFNKTLVDRQPYMYSEFYPAVARRVVEKVVELPVGKGDVHELTIAPKHPGIVFEKVVVDYGGYAPQYLFGEESSVKR